MTQGKPSGRRVVVTGAAGGIGLTIARRFARGGAKIAVGDVSATALEPVPALLREAGASEAIHVVGDLSTEAGAQALCSAAEAAFGGVDVLVNNAGGGVIRPFLEHTPETLRQTIDRNLWTTLWCCRAVLPGMIARGFGRIINIGADSVHTGTYSHAGYNAAKGGVNGLTTGLAFEFGKHGITVNTVSPGGVMTPELVALLADDPAMGSKHRMAVNPAALLDAVPIRRFTEMEEVAALVAFLASAEAAAINGQIYSINGGQWMM